MNAGLSKEDAPVLLNPISWDLLTRAIWGGRRGSGVLGMGVWFFLQLTLHF